MYTNRAQYSQNLESFDKPDRPDSSKLADLHVYILPRDFWRTKQNLAYNETIIESISAGFIRVTPETMLRNLRQEIQKQCTDEEVPKDFVFLRSVGRALTRVKPYQEQELKVKYFMPPQTVGPEIFLLEVDEQISGALLQKFDRPNIDFLTPTESNTFPNITNLKTSRDNELSRNSQFYSDTSAVKESTSSISNYDRLKDYDKMKEEQERLRNRQIYLEQLRKRQMEKLSNQNGKVDEDEHFPTDEDYLASRENYPSDDEDKEKSALRIQNAYRGYQDRERVKRLQREKALPIIEDKSERISENNDVGILEVENSEENLRERIKKIRQRRIEVENLRNDLLKHIKNVHNRISIRRKEEKKKTPAIEDKINSLLSEIEAANNKFFASHESDNYVNSFRNSTVSLKTSEAKAGRLESLKLEEEIFNLKRQINHAKLKLATDIKLRIQAENETKALKSELLQTKMNLLQIKNSD